jgi:hypothetical protein
LITGEYPAEVQHLLDLITDRFAVGLRMNADKSEPMIMEGREVSQPITQESYHHRITRMGKSRKEKIERTDTVQLMWIIC